MKVEDFKNAEIEQRSNRVALKLGAARPVDIWHTEGFIESKEEALRAAALFRAAYQIQKELKHLVRLLEPLEKNIGFNALELVSLNGARAALKLSEKLD